MSPFNTYTPIDKSLPAEQLKEYCINFIKKNFEVADNLNHVGHIMLAMSPKIFKLAFPGYRYRIHNLVDNPNVYLGQDYYNYLQELYENVE